MKPGRILFEIKVSHRFQSLVRPALFFALRKLPRYAQVIFKDLMNSNPNNIEISSVAAQTNDSTNIESNIIDQRGKLALKSSNTDQGDLRTGGGSGPTPDTITQNNPTISISQEIIDVSTSVNEAFAVLENTIKASHSSIKEKVMSNYVNQRFTLRPRATEIKPFQIRLDDHHVTQYDGRFNRIDGKTILNTHETEYRRYKLQSDLLERGASKIIKTVIESMGENHIRDHHGNLRVGGDLPVTPAIQEKASVLVEFMIKQNSLIESLAKGTNKTVADIESKVNLIVPVKASPKFQQEYSQFFHVSSNYRKTAYANIPRTKGQILPQEDLKTRRTQNRHDFAQLSVQMDTIPYLVNVSYEISNPANLGVEVFKHICDPVIQEATLTLDNLERSGELHYAAGELIRHVVKSSCEMGSKSLNEAIKGMLRTPEKTINAIAGRNKEFAEELTK